MSDGGKGGAVSVRNGTRVTLSSSTLRGNSAVDSGGALSLVEVAEAVQIERCDFRGNIGQSGGAFFLDSNATDGVAVVGTVFSDNQAGFNGGAIFGNSFTSIDVTNSTFLRNFGENGGGALLNDDFGTGLANISFQDSVFEDNGARVAGGLFVGGTSDTEVSILRSTFTGNNVTSQGGGIAMFGIASLNVRMTDFTSNEAGFAGGAANIFSSLANITVDECTFTSNRAGGLGGFGGAMNVETFDGVVDLLIHKSSFDMNVCEANPGLNCTGGGGIAVSRLRSLSVSQTNFTDNVCDNVGGGIFSTFVPSQTIEECIFGNNSAADDGGAVFCEGSRSAAVVRTTFVDNIAGGQGGGVFIQNFTSVQIADSDFTANNALNGGGLSTTSEVSAPSFVEILGCQFTRNSVPQFGRGGAIEGDGSPNSAFLIADSTSRSSLFLRNSAEDGGAVYVQNQQSFTSVGANYIANNANIPAGVGGAVFTLDSGPVNFTSNLFEQNQANTEGGALNLIDVSGTNPLFTNVSNVFINNTALFGGQEIFIIGLSTS